MILYKNKLIPYRAKSAARDLWLGFLLYSENKVEKNKRRKDGRAFLHGNIYIQDYKISFEIDACQPPAKEALNDLI